MVIDRTTGKGCALSIAAKTVTRNLIADGIIGKTIAKKERPKRSVWLRVRDYGDDWVCIGGNIAHELTEEPLWVPSFIDERIWTQAVSKFHIYLLNPLETLICQGFSLIKCSNLM